MPTDHATEDIAAYASAVRAELAGLPPADRESLLEDLEDHLAEVAAESAEPLAERLGPPAAYAAELLAAYGVRPGGGAGLVRRTLRRLTDWADGFAAYRSVRAFLPELRPAWWVARAYLAVLVLMVIVSNGGELRPVPNPVSRRGLLQIIATGVAIVISVRLGRGFRPSRAATRYLGFAANGLVAVFGLLALNSLGPGYTMGGSAYPGSTYYPGYSEAYALGPVTNIYPYSLDGHPLSDVLLYDQDGRPLMVSAKGGPVITQYPTAADGQPITNAYPLQQRHFDGSIVQAPRVALPPVLPSPSPSSTPSPTARPTP